MNGYVDLNRRAEGAVKGDEETARHLTWDESRTVSGIRAAIAHTSGKILLIDHYPDWLNFMAFILRRRGHEVFCSRTVEDAREVLHTEPLNVIVCGLAEDSGIVLLREAKILGGIRTVALSRDGSNLLGLPRGTVDMPLLRPVPILSLVETIESFLPATGQRLG